MSNSDKDADYVPEEEEKTEDDEEEESEKGEETVGESTTKKTKKTKKAKKKGKKKGTDEYKPSDSEPDDEEHSDTAEPSTSRKDKKTKKKSTKEKSPSNDDDDDDDDGDDDDKKEKKSSTKKIVEKLKETKELIPSVTQKLKKKSDDIEATEGEAGESDELDKLLTKFRLPSSSRPQIFNKNLSLIGSFNIQAFGTKKSSNHIIMRIITDIIRHYGIILCQEIRASEDIIQQLTDEVSTPSTPYAYVTSRPIGRTTYQERYVFLYRKNDWKVLEDYVVDDNKLGDQFIREPYVARFQHLRKSDVRVTLVGCHTQPDKAFEEVKSLISLVYIDVKKKLQRDTVQEKRQLDRGIEQQQKEKNKFFQLFWRYLCCCFGPYTRVSTRDFSEEALTEDTNEPIVMMGDFNAAGSYVNKTKRAELDNLLKENNLIWGIKHGTDTTVADGPDTAYDRFVFEAANERRWIGNAKVWRFDDGWVNEDDNTLVKKAAKRVSDHYPIEFEFKLT